MWPFNTPKQKANPAAPPPNINPYAFVVPSYRRGSPYSQEAVPQGGADTLGSHPNSEHDSQTITKQQRAWTFSFRPPAGLPPDGWTGYKQDNWIRSQRDEWLLFGEEGPLEHQVQQRMRDNPYETHPNIVNRPQRTPHDYSFIRSPEWNYLGKRNLSGEHYSQAQTVTDHSRLALKGQSPSKHRRSTFRMEPIQYGENTLTVSQQSGMVPQSATFVSPNAGFPAPSFRLS